MNINNYKHLRPNIAAVILLILISFGIYYKTFNIWHLGEEYNLLWDFHRIDKVTLLKYFFKPVTHLHTAYFTYRPIWYNYYAWLYKNYNLNPIPYHLTIIFLHTAISIMLFFCLLKFVNYKISLWTAIIFAVNPVSICTAAWWNSSGDLFFSFFLLIAFYLHIYSEELSAFRKFAISTVFIIALMSKENSILLLPLCILYDYFILKIKSGLFEKLKKIILRNIHLIVIFVGYICFRFFIFGSFQSYVGAPKITPSLILIVLLRRIRISLFYDMNFRGFEISSGYTAIINIFVALFLMVMFYYLFKTHKNKINRNFIFFCVFMYIISSMPVINISNSIKSYKLIMNTRYIYFPMIFVILPTIYLIINLFNSKTSSIILSVLLVFLIYKTYTRLDIFIEATEFSKNRFNKMIEHLKNNESIQLSEIKKIVYTPESNYKSLHWHQTDCVIENQFNLAKAYYKKSYPYY